MPESKEPKGLEANRQWYLYEQILPFFLTILQADFTCPKPTVPKPNFTCPKPTVPKPSSENVDSDILRTPVSSQRKRRATETLESETIVSYGSQDTVMSVKKARKCTLCGICGHNKRTCPSK